MRILNFTYTIVTLFLTVNVYAADLPTGGQVLYGDAVILSEKNSNYIASSSPKNVISWESFNVGKGKLVVFDNKSYLNLVRGSSASVIEGSINTVEKGEFYLVNPNGITLSSTGSINAYKVGLSTSKITEKQILNYVDSGDFTTSMQGMGKVKLIGNVKTSNLFIDGSQVIIRDIESIKNIESGSSSYLTNIDGNNLKIVSSTKRIDIGGQKGIDLKNTYKLSKEDGLYDHTGEIAISTKDEFLNISNNLNGNYFITNDIDLGTLNNTLSNGNAFQGKIDGAFNNVTFNLEMDGSKDTNVGLFSKLENATIENLKLKDSNITLKDGKDNTNVGSLAGCISNSALNNFEVSNFELIFSNLGANKVNVGAIAGASTGSKNSLHNVAASFSKKTLERLDNRDNVKTGLLISNVENQIAIQGNVFSNNESNNNFKLFGNNASDNLDLPSTINTDYYVLTDNGYGHKDFYAPFYVDDNRTYLYDENTSYNYFDMVNNPYFDVTNYVDVLLDYQGDISALGDYNHTYQNKNGGSQFYFVKNEKPYGSVSQTISIINLPVQTPTNTTWNSSNLGNFDYLEYFNDEDLFFSYSNHKFNYDKKKVKSKLSYSKEQESFSKLFSNTLLASLSLSSNDFDYYYAQNYDDDNNTQNS